MAYARLNGYDSDVYVFDTDEGGQHIFKCLWCHLGNGTFASETIPPLLAHLTQHREAGHRVPQRAIDELTGEMREFGERGDDRP